MLGFSQLRKDEQYLLSKGKALLPIRGDGNCLFGALANQLGEGQEAHDRLRKEAVMAMRRSPGEYAPFLDTDESFEDYLRSMACRTEWGGAMEVKAICMARGLNAVTWCEKAFGTSFSFAQKSAMLCHFGLHAAACPSILFFVLLPYGVGALPLVYFLDSIFTHLQCFSVFLKHFEAIRLKQWIPKSH